MISATKVELTTELNVPETRSGVVSWALAASVNRRAGFNTDLQQHIQYFMVVFVLIYGEQSFNNLTEATICINALCVKIFFRQQVSHNTYDCYHCTKNKKGLCDFVFVHIISK